MIVYISKGIKNQVGGIAIARKHKQRKIKTTHKAIEKEIVVAAVVDQIQIDIDKDETEALRMLVEYLPESILLSYLAYDYLEKGNVS